MKGNYSVGYEASATGAVKHTEGDMEKPAEEVLTLGYINFIEQYYKKWITVSDTVLRFRVRRSWITSWTSSDTSLQSHLRML